MGGSQHSCIRAKKLFRRLLKFFDAVWGQVGSDSGIGGKVGIGMRFFADVVRTDILADVAAEDVAGVLTANRFRYRFLCLD